MASLREPKPAFVPGSEADRKGRNPKPKKRYVIDLIEAAWVLQIFLWYAVEN